MSRKNAGKNSPDSISQIAALILMALGTLFSVLGLLGYVLDLPMKAGEARGSLPMGLVILAVGGACDLWARSKKAARIRLLTEGQPVPGEILEIRRHIFITWNENDWINFPGKNSPWSVSCRYTWEGREYTVQSPLIWREAVRSGPVTVYLDAKKPRRAAVDPDSVATVL